MALASLKKRKLPTVSSLSVLEVAFGIATAFDRTVYDALYIALAVQSRAQFITADEKLANARRALAREVARSYVAQLVLGGSFIACSSRPGVMAFTRVV